MQCHSTWSLSWALPGTGMVVAPTWAWALHPTAHLLLSSGPGTVFLFTPWAGAAGGVAGPWGGVTPCGMDVLAPGEDGGGEVVGRRDGVLLAPPPLAPWWSSLLGAWFLPLYSSWWTVSPTSKVSLGSLLPPHSPLELRIESYSPDSISTASATSLSKGFLNVLRTSALKAGGAARSGCLSL